MVEISIGNMHNLKVTGNTMRPLLFLLQQNNIDWMHACGGKGRCTTCKARVKSGLENFQPLTSAEQGYREIGALRDDERLACQAEITGNVVIVVPDECKFPHIQYSDE